MRADLLTSGIWQTNTTLLSHQGRSVVVDPAYFPRELEAVVALAAERGPADAVVFTHGHWDHVMGHAAFPHTPVWVSRTLEQSIARRDPRAERYLQDARDFDSRWYVPRPGGHCWPETLRGLDDGAEVELAGIPLRALHLAGHSPDGLGLLVEREGLLLVGDHLSPCEIPFVDDAAAYRATLVRLLDLLDGAVNDVIPGHGARLTGTEASAIAREDLDYLDRLIAAGARRDVDAARAIALPRATHVVGMRDAHRENCATLGLSI